MPFATGAIHVSQPLVDLCLSYKPDEDDYIRNVFFPRKPVQHDTDQVWQISKQDILRLYDLDASDHAATPTVTYRTNGTYTYTCQPFASKVVLSPREMKNADAALRHEMRQTKQALISMGIRMEYLAVNQTLRSASVMTNNETLTAAERWDNFSSTSSQPIEDLQAAISQIRVRCGVGRKKVEGTGGGRIKIAMSEYVAMTLQQHPNVLSRLTWTPNGTGAILTQKILAEILGIAEGDVYITANQYTSSQEGETAAYKLFLGSDVILGYVDSDPEYDYALGHEFIFDGLNGEQPFLVRRWRDENIGYQGVDYIGTGCVTDYKVTNTDAGHLFKAVLDTSDTDRYGSFLD